ncbi:GFA family protein [Aphanothece minutissima]|uniref:Ribulose phosphate epimerase n=1 Tax=Aphanothece cf. minutissima CCALA 015 TaxID=2107695 RepID=A0ABX5F7Z4_9CHRO|nr:GFA family protein [Aphanothece minutissima]PSB37593.1 ribulose phosphate epimerase [Aphanothece cf. minutissima CCALA 015]
MKPRIFEGGCLCGAIRFRATGVPERPHTCSCAICRRHSGALTLTWVEFPAASVEWIGPGGRPATWRSSGFSSRAFCSTCGTTIGAIDDEPIVALATGAFDKPHLKDLAPTAHSYLSRRPRWWHAASDAETRQGRDSP